MTYQLRIGTILNNKYRVGDAIANGGFGTVYLAEIMTDSLTNYLINDYPYSQKKCVAIKRINTKNTTHRDIYRRTENEIKIHKLLHHKYIEAFDDSESINIVMEYCSNDTLYKLLREHGSFSETDTRHYTYQLLIGLKYIHENNIIHRDLKLSNLLLNSNNTLKIADFGLATLLKSKEEERHSVCGTYEYLSPEMLKCKNPNYDIAVDIWAVGCIMYYLLTNEPPFKCDNNEDTRERIIACDYTIPANDNLLSKDASYLIRHILVEKEKRYNIQQILDSKFMKSSTDILTNSSLSISNSIDEVTKINQNNNYLIESKKSTPITSPLKDNNNIIYTNTVVIESNNNNNNNNNNNRNVIKIDRLLTHYTKFPPFDLSFLNILKPKKKLSEFGYIQILKSKKIRIFFQEDSTGVQIQDNGFTVSLCGNNPSPINCSISQIPNSWNNKLSFCYKVINCLKSFTPQVCVYGGKYICKLMSNSPVPDFIYTTLNYRFFYYMNRKYIKINDISNNKIYYHSLCPDRNGNYIVDKRTCTNEFCSCKINEKDDDNDEIEISKYANPIPIEFNGYIMDGFKNYQLCLKIKEKYGKNRSDTIMVNLNH